MKPQIRVVHSNNNGNQQSSMVDPLSSPMEKRLSKDHLPMLVPVHVPRVPPTTHGPASQSTQAPAQDAPRYYCRDPYQEPNGRLQLFQRCHRHGIHRCQPLHSASLDLQIPTLVRRLQHASVQIAPLNQHTSHKDKCPLHTIHRRTLALARWAMVKQ